MVFFSFFFRSLPFLAHILNEHSLIWPFLEQTQKQKFKIKAYSRFSAFNFLLSLLPHIPFYFLSVLNVLVLAPFSNYSLLSNKSALNFGKIKSCKKTKFQIIKHKSLKETAFQFETNHISFISLFLLVKTLLTAKVIINVSSCLCLSLFIYTFIHPFFFFILATLFKYSDHSILIFTSSLVKLCFFRFVHHLSYLLWYVVFYSSPDETFGNLLALFLSFYQVQMLFFLLLFLLLLWSLYSLNLNWLRNDNTSRLFLKWPHFLCFFLFIFFRL